MRLAKFLAHAGIASRRRSEDLIRQGLVKVNDHTIQDPAFSVNSKDRITYRDQLVGKESHVYYKFHKPAGVTSTLKDPHAARTLKVYLKKIPERVFPVGRLDKSSTGLMILTNDGALMNRLTHPRFEVIKTYEVCVGGAPNLEDLKELTKGIHSEGERLVARSAKVIKQMRDRSIVRVELSEGKKRELRRMMKALGFTTISLKRTEFGGLTIGSLKSGELKKLTQPEITLLKQV